jgi:hypothetical protein
MHRHATHRAHMYLAEFYYIKFHENETGKPVTKHKHFPVRCIDSHDELSCKTVYEIHVVSKAYKLIRDKLFQYVMHVVTVWVKNVQSSSEYCSILQSPVLIRQN